MRPCFHYEVLPVLVIVNAVKNLVLYLDVALFLWENDTKKGGIWVLRDEMLRCAQCCNN
jgi:hypothetical protein